MPDAQRRPGRPPLDPSDRSVVVSIRLPGRAFDRVYARATRLRLTVPELIRRDLRRAQARSDDGQ